jgi:hypothetical protein
MRIGKMALQLNQIRPFATARIQHSLRLYFDQFKFIPHPSGDFTSKEVRGFNTIMPREKLADKLQINWGAQCHGIWGQH